MRFTVPAFVCAACLAMTSGTDTAPVALRLVQRVALPGVAGRIDHLAVDVDGRRLFVAALGNGSVEAIDLASSRWIRSVVGFDEPQGLAWLSSRRQLIVASGGSGEVTFLDGTDFRVLRRAALGDDADNVRVEAGGQHVWVGYGQGGLAAITAVAAKASSVPLGGHPESFQLIGPTLLAVNVPSKRAVLVVDRVARRIIRTIAVQDAEANYPMAVDEAHHRLFIGCRRPAVLLVFDLDTGARVTTVPIGADTDDLFYDATRRRLYVVCGEGRVDVIRQETPDRYAAEAHVPTSPGARTGLLVPSLDTLFVAAPRRGDHDAEILLFSPGA